MGFRKQKITYNLVWPEDHDYHGLEVLTKSLSVSELMDLTRMAEKANAADADMAADASDKMLSTFAKSLISWNLEDEDGTPVPATRDGISDQDMAFVQSVLAEWMGAVAGVSAPLDKASASTGISGETLNLAELSSPLK